MSFLLLNDTTLKKGKYGIEEINKRDGEQPNHQAREARIVWDTQRILIP